MTVDKGIFIQNIYYMLSYAFQILKQEDYKQVAGEKFEKIHDLFAAILEKGVSRQVKQGLYREYVPMHEDLSVMRGKLNMGETIRLKVQNKQKLGCEFDEFSEDNLYNQILKVTIHRLIRADDVAPERKQALRRVSVFFGNVKLIQPDHIAWNRLIYQPNRKLFDVMTKGSGDARMQPLYFLITTAGTDTNSICYEQHQKAQDILEGRKIDKTFYPVIYGAPDDADWTSPEVWKKSNPSLGETIGMDKVEAACESAKQNPGEENAFRQLRLNQWVKQTVRWMPMHKWDACKVDFDESLLEGRVCYGGLDLSSTTDITAFVLVFPPTDEDDHYYILPYFWLPEETLDLRVRRDHVPYDLWQRQGFLMTTEGNVVHYGFIENFIDELGTRFNIREIAFDRWGAVQMSQNLEGLGFTLVQFGQGYRDMSPPTKELMKLTLEQKIAHNGHPVLRWNMDNIFIKRDPAGNIKPDKEKSTEKIDGTVATIMALDRAIRCGNDSGESVYDERELLVL